MRVLLIFVLVNTAVCVEEEGTEKEITHLHKILSEEVCNEYAIEMYNECQSCAEQVATEIQVEKNKYGDYDIMSENNIPKTKEIVTKCYKYFADSEQFVKCTEMDEKGFISCMKSVFPAQDKKDMATVLCARSGSRENEATEITNNCNHFFKNKIMIKKCAKKGFGERMICALESMYFYSELENPAFILCYYGIEDYSMEENCQECVSQIIHSDDIEYYEDDQLQEKEYYTKTIEKCGQYFQKKEELMECTRKEADLKISCFEDVQIMITITTRAKMMCRETEKSDECVECIYKSLLSAWEAYMNSPSAELEDFDYLNELETKEISSNCSQYRQYLQKEEE